MLVDKDGNPFDREAFNCLLPVELGEYCKFILCLNECPEIRKKLEGILREMEKEGRR